MGPFAAFADATGGTPAPGSSGGAQYGHLPALDRPQPLSVRAFRVSPATIRPGARSARLAFRIEGGAPRVVVRFSITPAGESAAAHTVVWRARPGRRYARKVALPGSKLTAGRYEAILQVGDARAPGRMLRAHGTVARVALTVAAPAPRPTPSPQPAAPTTAPVPASAPAGQVAGGVFPVRGSYSFGGDSARFGGDRGSRAHRGQDVIAAEGTPLVAPRPGTVHVRGYQGGGAGHYLVVRGADRRDYVFMHMRDASPLGPGAAVSAGTPIGYVGNTGASSGPHLHFEIWPNGWYASESSQPIDPLPELLAWAGG